MVLDTPWVSVPNEFGSFTVRRIESGKVISLDNVFSSEGIADEVAGRTNKELYRDMIIELINKPVSSKKTSTNKTVGKCPDCGSNLIVKNGKFGKFLGCCAFPDCRYTKKLSIGDEDLYNTSPVDDDYNEQIPYASPVDDDDTPF